jgi:predicted ATPase
VRCKRALIVLDCCEHLLDDLAPIVERLLRETADVHILATSREPLRARGEYVEQLSALAFPSSRDGIDAAEANRFSAVQLFTERAAADLSSFELDDESAPFVVDICRKLDGIALAIELAAACVPAHRVKEIDALIEDRFGLLTRGRRTADPRHQTLRATLDWSYDLLSDLERTVLCRLSLFVGHWSLKAGLQVAASTDLAETDVLQALGKLISKSLVSVDRAPPFARYRLLDTTRSYARGKLEARGNIDEIARQHALFFCRLLEDSNDEFPNAPGVPRRTAIENVLGNVRAALKWCFSSDGDAALGAALVAVSGPYFLELSLLAECRRWSELALASLDASALGTPRELEVQELRGLSLLYATGNNQAVGDIFERALALAEALGDHHRQLRVLGDLHIHHLRMAEYRKTLEVAQRSEKLARAMNDRGAARLSEWLLGMAHYHLGNQSLALRYCGSALSNSDTSHQLEMARVGVSHRLRALSAFARSLWLNGRPDEAARAAKIGIEAAERLAHPATLSVTLIWSVPVYIWIGDLEAATEITTRLSKIVDEHSLLSFRAVALGIEGELLLKRGHAIEAVRKLQDCLKAVGWGLPRLVASTFGHKLAEALLGADQSSEALLTIESAIKQARDTGELVNLPEMMRVKANILRSMSRSAEAEDHLLSSMELARKQAALSWELRAAIDLAQQWEEQGRVAKGMKLLDRVYRCFTEGLGTQDLIRAREVLNRLAGETGPD